MAGVPSFCSMRASSPVGGSAMLPETKIRVAVGTPVAGCPPPRSVRAELPHTAPASSRTRLAGSERSDPDMPMARSSRRPLPLCCGSVSANAFRLAASSWLTPFPPPTPQGLRPSVRRLLRYYDAIRLLGGTNDRITAIDLPCRLWQGRSVARARLLPEVSRFPRGECPRMPGSLTPPERCTSRLATCPVLPSRQSTSSASGTRCFRSSIARLRFPLSTLPHALAGRRGMTRGQCGSLRLHCTTLSFATLRRFSSALSDRPLGPTMLTTEYRLG